MSENQIMMINAQLCEYTRKMITMIYTLQDLLKKSTVKFCVSTTVLMLILALYQTLAFFFFSIYNAMTFYFYFFY